jgi:hypothetical protein
MIGTDAQKRSFRDRLTRIEQGGANTTRHVYVGPVQDPVGGQARKARRAPSVGRAGPRRRLAGELFMVPFAMFCGMLSVVATRVAFFHHLGGLEQLGGEFHGVALTTIAAAAMALLLFVVLRILFGAGGAAACRAVRGHRGGAAARSLRADLFAPACRPSGRDARLSGAATGHPIGLSSPFRRLAACSAPGALHLPGRGAVVPPPCHDSGRCDHA